MIECKRDEKGVEYINLNRPEIHNAFNDEMIKELTEKFNSLSEDKSCRLIVITGNGKSFCAGADLNWMKSMKDYSFEQNVADSKALDGLFKAIDNCSKPVIGKINGAALGGGVGVLSCVDYAIASERAKFGLTEVRLGLLPAVISPYVIRKIGRSWARATFMSGAFFDAWKAFHMGLVHEVVKPEELDDKTQALINEFLVAAPQAQIMAKELINEVYGKEDPSDYTCELIAKKRIGPEGQEGMSALLEKRKVKWPN